MAGVLYMESVGIAIRMGLSEIQERNTGMQSGTGIRGKKYTIVRNNKVST